MQGAQRRAIIIARMAATSVVVAIAAFIANLDITAAHWISAITLVGIAAMGLWAVTRRPAGTYSLNERVFYMDPDGDLRLVRPDCEVTQKRLRVALDELAKEATRHREDGRPVLMPDTPPKGDA
jgi:hypothetical protein